MASEKTIPVITNSANSSRNKINSDISSITPKPKEPEKDNCEFSLEIVDINSFTNKSNSNNINNTNEDVLEKQSYVVQPKPNALCILAICVVMSGTLMFGADTTLFGAIQSVDSFVEKFCPGNYGTAQECGVDKAYCETQIGIGVCDGTTTATACCSAITSNNSGWVNVFLMLGNFLLYFGAAWGALLLGPIVSERFGRRIPVVVGCIIAIIGCVFQSYGNFSSIEVFLTARFVLGFGAGTALCILPMYNAEVAVPQWRGLTGGLFQFFVVISGFTAVFLTKFITNYQIILMIPAFAACIPLAGIMFIPESPRYLMKHKSYEKGKIELQKMRALDCEEEAREIWESLENEKLTAKMTYVDIFTNKSTRVRLFVAVMFQIVQQFSGVNMILGYFGTLMGQIAPDFDPFTASIIYQSCFVVGSAIGVMSLDFKYGGRRIQTLIGLVVCCVAYLISGSTIAAAGNGYIALVGIFIFGFGFQISIGIMPWLYPSEIFTIAEREKCMSVTVWVQYIASAIIVVISPYMIDWSVYGTFFLFFAFCLIWVAWAWFFVKETRGVVLEIIPALFN
eukprot:Pgem_evm1s16403